jgi:hypothetical protein
LIFDSVSEKITTDAQFESRIERRDARESNSRSFFSHSRFVSKSMIAPIPVYNADGSLYACASEQRFARLQAAGMVARVVRRRKGGIARAILFSRPGEPKPLSASSLVGTAYSFKEHLEHGRPWELKHLGGAREGKTYAPPELRAVFLQVVADCSVP